MRPSLSSSKMIARKNKAVPLRFLNPYYQGKRDLTWSDQDGRSCANTPNTTTSNRCANASEMQSSSVRYVVEQQTARTTFVGLLISKQILLERRNELSRIILSSILCNKQPSDWETPHAVVVPQVCNTRLSLDNEV